MSLPHTLTPEQQSLLDQYLAEPRSIRAIVDAEETRDRAHVLAEHYQLPVAVQGTEYGYLYLYVLGAYRDLGPGIYLVNDPDSLPSNTPALKGPTGYLFTSMPAPRLELSLADGQTWVHALDQGPADSPTHRALRVAALSIQIPKATSVRLVGAGPFRGLRLNRLELISDSLVIFSWRARSDLRLSSRTGIEVAPALGDGLGQIFEFREPTCSMDFAISSEVLALADALTLDFELLSELAPPPQRVSLIQQGLSNDTLRRLEASLTEKEGTGPGLRDQHIAQLDETAKRLATSQSSLARLTARGLGPLRSAVKRSVTRSRPTTYERWLEEYDSLHTPQVLDYLNQVKDAPSISIIVPIYRPDIEFLSEAIDSVIGQSWHQWELILSVDGPHDPEVTAQIETIAGRHPNVQMLTSDQRGNIARATMAGVTRSTGAFLAFLDQDDLLHPDALAWISAYLHALPTAKLIYTDEDKIEDSQRSDPFFKPDYSPEYLLGVNYINHLTVIERATFNKAGGLIVGTEGAQDWDLLLRASAQLHPDEIVHIPKVLYHWRSHPNSTAQSYAAKPEVIAAQERVVAEQLKREGYSLQWLERPRSAPIFVLPHLRPTKDHVVSIIIPTKDHVDDLQTCIDSILASYYEAIEILVIDNASTDPATLAYLNALEAPVRVVRYHEPFNFATMVNYGVRQAVGDLVLLLNNDTRVINPNWLTEMAALAERPSIGAVGAKLLYPDASVQHSGVCLGIAGSAGHYGWAKDHRDPGDHGRGVLLSNTAAVTGAALMVERRKYIEVQGLNPELAISFNDVELCLALRRAGYRSVVTPSATLYHFESKSRGYNLTREQHYREDLESAHFYRHWPFIIPNDPYYSPNLSLELLEMFEPIGEPRVQLPWEIQHVTLVHPSPHVSANDAWYELLPSGQLCFTIPVDADQLPHWTSLAMTIFSINRQWAGHSSGRFELQLTCNGVCRSFTGAIDQSPESHTTPVKLYVRTKDVSPGLDSPANAASNRSTPVTANPSEDADRFDEALSCGYPVTATLINPNDSSLYVKCVDLPSGLAAEGTTNVVPCLLLGLAYRSDERHIPTNAMNKSALHHVSEP